MMFWIVITTTAIAAGFWIAWPFLRAKPGELSGVDGALSIYRDQMKEVDRDRASGLISATEAEAATLEIERRALHVSRQNERALVASRGAPMATLGLTAVTAILGLALYAGLGAPDAPDQPLAARADDILHQKAEAGDLRSSIQLLAQKAEQDPENLDAWVLLAQSYAVIGDYAKSRDAYGKASDLATDQPEIQSAYAEAIVSANNDVVSAEARELFLQLAQDFNDPRAHYYLSLAKAQAQDYQGALVGWVTLLDSSDPSAPWVPLVRRDIVDVARTIGADLRQILPDATPAEIKTAQNNVASGPALSSSADIANLVNRLAKTPRDFKGWIELARLYVDSNDPDAARDALNTARVEYANAPFVSRKIDEAEQALGLALNKGPDAAAVAAMSELSQGERDQMIDDMVAGLADRLQDDPMDLDGWVMLVRSYATLGRDEQAKQAYKTALAVFETDTVSLATLKEAAGQLVQR
ncbi:c-type cytochrome biogenesis protein CcmI [Rhodobacteraceae bacterium M382]|nr:c-type cytochrome biogenesis protein CcmI [Rhodobacteraceae bacterium M382]